METTNDRDEKTGQFADENALGFRPGENSAKTTLTDQRVDSLVESIANGATYTAAARAVGISASTFRKWRRIGEVELDAVGNDQERLSIFGRMADRGVPIHVASKMLGHSSITTTAEHYLDVDENTADLVRAAASGMNSGDDSVARQWLAKRSASA
jgi:transposase-like protein